MTSRPVEEARAQAGTFKPWLSLRPPAAAATVTPEPPANVAQRALQRTPDTHPSSCAKPACSSGPLEDESDVRSPARRGGVPTRWPRANVATLLPSLLSRARAGRELPVRKLFRLIQLEQVAERIVQKGLASGARGKGDPVHLDAVLLQVGDGAIDVVDADREVVRGERLCVGFHQVHLLAAGIEPVSRAEIGARQLRHAEHVAIEGETLLRVGNADGDMVYTGRLHRSILTRSLHPV